MNVRRALVSVAAAAAACTVAAPPATAAELAKYGEIRDFLVAHTKVVELTGENGQRIAICPEYQGRVMTSSTADVEGRSLGWVNTDFIAKGEPDAHFNNFGGEDRLWLAPEGGPFSLWFAPGARTGSGQLGHPAGAQRRRLPDRLGAGRALLSLEPAREAAKRLPHAVRSGDQPRDSPAEAAPLRQAVRPRRPGGRHRHADGRISIDQHPGQSRRSHDPRSRARFDLEPGAVSGRTADVHHHAVSRRQRLRPGCDRQRRLFWPRAGRAAARQLRGDLVSRRRQVPLEDRRAAAAGPFGGRFARPGKPASSRWYIFRCRPIRPSMLI